MRFIQDQSSGNYAVAVIRMRLKKIQVHCPRLLGNRACPWRQEHPSADGDELSPLGAITVDNGLPLESVAVEKLLFVK